MPIVSAARFRDALFSIKAMKINLSNRGECSGPMMADFQEFQRPLAVRKA
jgi:hypothetical protein